MLKRIWDWTCTNEPSVGNLPRSSRRRPNVGESSEATDEGGNMCDSYLTRIIECVNQAREMTAGPSEYGKVKLNPNQCAYLVERLQTVVEDTRKSYPQFSRKHVSKCLPALKILHRVAKEAEGFIQVCCCKDIKTWLQAAITSETVPMLVTSMGFDLKLSCTMLQRYARVNDSKLKSWWEAEFVAARERAAPDEEALMRLLDSSDLSLLTKSIPSEVQLACILGNRKKATQRGISSTLEDLVNVWETDRKFLSELVSLRRDSCVQLFKAKWLGAVDVAVKEFSSGTERIAEMEAMSMAKLSHPNIVSLFGITMDKKKERESFSIIMELMDGDLKTLMRRRMQGDSYHTLPFTIREACDLMLQIAEGVLHMHENGVIHRDLKSFNILVQSSKVEEDVELIRAKVADFGTAKMNAKSSTLSPLTCNQGTTRWMAPELFPSESVGVEIPAEETKTWYPYKSDVYSLGMLFYEILTDDIPFSTYGNYEVRRRVLAGGRPSLEYEYPANLVKLVESCWQQEPSNRPSVAEVCEKLRSIKYSALREPIDKRARLIHKPRNEVVYDAEYVKTPNRCRYEVVRDVAYVRTPMRCSRRREFADSEVTRFQVNYSSLQVVRLLARGGSDLVTLYVASWQESDTQKRDVAQKTFQNIQDFRMGFKNEVSILASLKNDNVIPLLCYARNSRSASIVMDLMDGDLCYFVNMKKHMVTGDSTSTLVFTMTEVVHIILQIAQGMQYVHGQGIVHMDLKSTNILVKGRGVMVDDVREWDVKVADFQFAKRMHGEQPVEDSNAVVALSELAEAVEKPINVRDRDVEVDGFHLAEKVEKRSVLYKALAIGSIRWTAPEIAQEVMDHSCNVHRWGMNYYDPFQADVYSFGMVCYEILTGNVPYHEIEDLEEVKEKILHNEDLLQNLPQETLPNIRDIVGKCLLREASERPSFDEVVEMLQAIQID